MKKFIRITTIVLQVAILASALHGLIKKTR
jgi:hypothetical protein